MRHSSESIEAIRPARSAPGKHLSPEVRLSLRAAFCLTSVLLVGLWPAARVDSTLVALGSLWVISQDGLDQWRIRRRRLVAVSVATTLGFAAGAGAVLVAPQANALYVIYGVSALIAGLLEASHYASAGAYFITGVVVGAGVGFTHLQVTAVLCVAGGSLWVLAVAFLMDRRNARINQRFVLSDAYASLADLFESVGHDNFSAVRHSTVAALDAAQDVIGSDDARSARRREPDNELLSLRQALVVALQCGEVVSLVVGGHLSIDDASMSVALRHVASTLRQRSAREAINELRELRRTSDARGDVSMAWRAALRAPERDTLTRRTPFVSSRPRLRTSERWRFALLLLVVVEIATSITQLRGGSHEFWLPLAVVYIFRPDLGSVIERAFARTVGTAIGTVIAAGLAAVGDPTLGLIALSCLMAGAVPYAARRSHALTVVAFTPIVFVIVGALEPVSGLFWPRVIDTALAALVVLGVDLLVWSRAPSLRPHQQVTSARLAAEMYQREANLDDVLLRHRLRRNALRAVTDARVSLAAASREHRDRHVLELRGELDEIEHAIDHTTAHVLLGT